MKSLPNPVSPGRAVALLSIFLAFQFGVAIALTGLGLTLGALDSDWGFSLFDSPFALAAVNILAAVGVIDIERRHLAYPRRLKFPLFRVQQISVLEGCLMNSPKS